jgi:lipoprotein-releasing system permease protein
LAVRYLRVHRGRTFLSVITAISVAGVAVGTAALVIALALMTGFEEDMKQGSCAAAPHLQALDRAESSFADADDVVALARGIPGVAAAAPVLFSPAMIMNDAQGSPSYAEIEGVDPALQQRWSTSGPWRAPGPLDALARPSRAAGPVRCWERTWQRIWRSSPASSCVCWSPRCG